MEGLGNAWGGPTEGLGRLGKGLVKASGSLGERSGCVIGERSWGSGGMGYGVWEETGQGDQNGDKARVRSPPMSASACSCAARTAGLPTTDSFPLLIPGDLLNV